MVAIIHDEGFARRLIRYRWQRGLARFDEV
jgi:hypothetical protein